MAVREDLAAAQFENVNSMRRYPFSDACPMSDRNGRTLPENAIVDLHVVVPADMEGSGRGFSAVEFPEVRLASFHVSPSMVSACFTSGAAALSVTVSARSFRPYFPYRLESLAGTENSGGAVTFGDMEIPGFPETYFFDAGSAVVHPCCVALAKPPALRRFVDRRSGETVSGDVEIRFSGYVASGMDDGAFSLSLNDGAAEALASECSRTSGAEACGATPIRSINGVRPDEDGNIVLWFH
jgi:hypothetical protein